MPKLLGEFLQEQQEPFVLDAYLLERGYSTHRNRRQAIPNCTAIVTAVLSRLVLHNNHNTRCRKGLKSNDRKTRQEEEDHADEDIFSSASSTILYNSCSETDVEDDAEFITKPSSSSHELSPVSVLEDKECQGSSFHKKKQYNLSYECKSRQATHKLEEDHDPYSMNKRALQETRRLLVDCVREVIENERKRDDGTGQQLNKVLGAEELWKLVCENVWLWSQHSIDETNIVHMLNCDFMASLQEWSSAFDLRKNEIAMEIGDAILEDIVTQIVTC